MIYYYIIQIYKFNYITFNSFFVESIVQWLLLHPVYLQFWKTLKTYSGDQDRCSFHGPGSGSCHGGNLNSSIIATCKCATSPLLAIIWTDVDGGRPAAWMSRWFDEWNQWATLMSAHWYNRHSSTSSRLVVIRYFCISRRHSSRSCDRNTQL